MTQLRALLLASLTAAFSMTASAQVIHPDATRTTPSASPVRFVTSEGFNLSAGAATASLDLVDVHPNSAFVIEGPIHMAMEGFVVFVADCAVYSGDRIIARFNRGAPVIDGPFEGRFRFGLVRTAEGAPSGYACWANAYGNRSGANWRAYEVPNPSVPGGQVQFVKYEDGRFWDGGAITQQVLLHFSGSMPVIAQPTAPANAAMRQGPNVPDGSELMWRPPIVPPTQSMVEWRPPIIPPAYAAQIADGRAGLRGADWASAIYMNQGGDVSASDYLRDGETSASDYLRNGNVAVPTTNMPVAQPVQPQRP